MNHPFQRDSARAKRIHHRERILARAERAYADIYSEPDREHLSCKFRWIGLDGRERWGLPTWEDVRECRRASAVRDMRLSRFIPSVCPCSFCERIPGQSMHERRAAHSAREQLRCLDEAEPA